jgi:SET domain-containing protein
MKFVYRSAPFMVTAFTPHKILRKAQTLGRKRFINHSDQANCYLECTQDWDDYLVYNIITKRPIKKDEELTLNYEV